MSFGRGLLLLLGLLVPASAGAQEPGAPSPIELRVDPRDGSVAVRFGGLLAGAELEEATREGLPLRIHVVAELWKDRFFDGQEGRAEWRATVVYDPLERRYLIRTSEDGDPPRTVPTLAAAGAELQRRFTVPLRPTSEGTFYYLATVEVETLSLSDLEELQRWLQGELAPAVGGEGDVEGAMGRGVRRLMVRMLGLPVRRVRLRSERFRFEPGSAREKETGVDRKGLPPPVPGGPSAPIPGREDRPSGRQGLDPALVGCHADPDTLRHP